jgi:hypothetical protein
MRRECVGDRYGFVVDCRLRSRRRIRDRNYHRRWRRQWQRCYLADLHAEFRHGDGQEFRRQLLAVAPVAPNCFLSKSPESSKRLRSASQSTILAFPAQDSKILRRLVCFLLSEGTGEP